MKKFITTALATMVAFYGYSQDGVHLPLTGGTITGGVNFANGILAQFYNPGNTSSAVIYNTGLFRIAKSDGSNAFIYDYQTGNVTISGVIRYGNSNSSVGALSYSSAGLITLEASSNNTGIALLPSGTGNVGIGTTNPDSKLTVAGKIHSQEVKVTVNAGADFVFQKDYHLKPLSEVEKYITENKHLPEIASANEMKNNGLELGEMNIKLLQKIEELTLYMIDFKKEMEVIKSENQTLKTKVVQLESSK
jgi:hypothetical protein